MKARIRRGSMLGTVLIVVMAILNVYLFGIGIKMTSDYFNASLTTKLFNTEVNTLYNLIDKNAFAYSEEESSKNKLVFNNGVLIYEKDNYLVVDKNGVVTSFKFINKMEVNEINEVAIMDLQDNEQNIKVDNLIDVIVKSDRKDTNTFSVRRVFYVK